MNNWVTSDLHFGHKNIIKYENRPFKDIEEMDKAIIELWNKTVKKDDKIYILGDFSWYKGEKTNEILYKLNGNKFLIIGNHDKNFLDDKRFNKNLFEEICYYKEIKINKKKIVMFHYPIAEWNGQINGSIHLFGHIHTIKSNTSEYMNKLNNEYGYKCINVGIDVHKRLLNLEELL
jgi:hypothetical protein|nr:MAG TPA: metallophosphatase domain protein [Caudoviricetes sp.]